MAEEKDLLLAIAKSQHKDIPSILVYTDWLQDHGHTLRAEYIRSCVALFQGRPSREAKRLINKRSSLEKYVEKRYIFDVVSAACGNAGFGFSHSDLGLLGLFHCYTIHWSALAGPLMAVQPLFRVYLAGNREEIDKDALLRPDWGHLYFNFSW